MDNRESLNYYFDIKTEYETFFMVKIISQQM